MRKRVSCTEWLQRAPTRSRVVLVSFRALCLCLLSIPDNSCQFGQRASFHGVPLVDESLFPQVETSPRPTAGRPAVVAVVKAPTGSTTRHSALQVDDKVVHGWLPTFAEIAPERLLVV